jgi:hypothetical protein
MDEIAVFIESLTSVLEYEHHLADCQDIEKALRADRTWIFQAGQCISESHFLAPTAKDQSILMVESYIESRSLNARIDTLIRSGCGSSKEVSDLIAQRELVIRDLHFRQRDLIDTIVEILKTPVAGETENFWTKNPRFTDVVNFTAINGVMSCFLFVCLYIYVEYFS